MSKAVEQNKLRLKVLVRITFVIEVYVYRQR